MSELLPCPFCGSAPEINEQEEEGRPFTSIECASEGCVVQPVACVDGWGCTDAAAEIWNRRTMPASHGPTDDELIAALRRRPYNRAAREAADRLEALTARSRPIPPA